MSLSQKIEYSNCRTLPIESYGYVVKGKERDQWKHKGESELLLSSYIDCTSADLDYKLKVIFKDGTFVYVTKK